jgi:death-on-curing family protein
MSAKITFIEDTAIAYPSVQTIIAIHRAAYRTSQTTEDAIAQGAPIIGNIERSLHQVINHAGIRGSRRTRLVTKAAHLMLRIMAGHSFTDGNKRTAFMTGMLFLTVNGCSMRSISLSEYQRSLTFFRRIASSNVHDPKAVRSLRRWIMRRVKSYDNPRVY